MSVQEGSGAAGEDRRKGAAKNQKTRLGDQRVYSSVEMAEFTDKELAVQLSEELRSHTPRARRFAVLVGGGAKPEEAARAARLSSNEATLRHTRERVRGVLQLMQEQVRRESRLTAHAAVDRFDEMSKAALAAEDFGAAARALREACLLLGHYPDAKLKVEHSVNFSEVTPEEWEALALLRHGVRKQDVIEAHAIEVPALPPHEDEP